MPESLLHYLDTSDGCTNRYPTKPGWYIRECNKEWDWGQGNGVEKIRVDFVDGRLMAVEAYEMALDKLYKEGGKLVELPVAAWTLPEPVWDPDSQFEMFCLFKPCERDTPIPQECWEHDALSGYPLLRFGAVCSTCSSPAVDYWLRDEKQHDDGRHLIVCSDEKCPGHIGVIKTNNRAKDK